MSAAGPTLAAVLEQAIYLGDNLDLLPRLPDEAFTLVYIDPPFNTGKEQRRLTLATSRDDDGDRTGFGGARYRSEPLGSRSYPDRFDDYLAFIEPRVREARRLLAGDGTLYFHIDYREAHYCKLLLDEIFGRDAFLNEIIWAYDYGARAKRRWPAKHDTILVYVKDPDAYFFDSEAVDREPYMAPGLVTAEKAARGKLPTDVWWHTIVSPTGKEKTGYPNQKPLGVLRRIVQASSRGRLVPRLLRRQRHARRGRARARAALRPLRLEPGGGRDHAQPSRAAGADGRRRAGASDRGTRERWKLGLLAVRPGPRTSGYSPAVAGLSVRDLVAARGSESIELWARTINPQFARVLKTIGFDRTWVRAEGAYLWDAKGNRFLDLLGGFGMFNVGRNNPRVRAALVEALELDLPGSVQLGREPLPPLLAEELLRRTPARLERVLFTNSGTEAVEAALKLGRAATGRPGSSRPRTGFTA